MQTAEKLTQPANVDVMLTFAVVMEDVGVGSGLYYCPTSAILVVFGQQ